MNDLQVATFETPSVYLFMMFQSSILTILLFMFSLNHFIMSCNYITPLHIHDAPTSFPSYIIVIQHFKISQFMTNNHKKHAIEITLY